MDQTNFPNNPLPSETMVVSSVPPAKAKFDAKIILIGFSVLALSGMIFGISKFTGLFSKAAGGAECELDGIPTIEALKANSIEITFKTKEVCQTVIAYGTSAQPEALLLEMPEAMASASHRIKLSPLLPSTTYYYQVKSNDKPVGTIYNFLTARSEGSAAVRPTEVPVAPPPATTNTTTYTFEDFSRYFGEKNSTFDINKDGIVNFADWDTYQTSKTR